MRPRSVPVPFGSYLFRYQKYHYAVFGTTMHQINFVTFDGLLHCQQFKQESRAVAGKPRDAVVNFDVYSLALYIT